MTKHKATQYSIQTNKSHKTAPQYTPHWSNSSSKHVT